MINALYCIAYNKDSYVMQWIVVHCIVIDCYAIVQNQSHDKHVCIVVYHMENILV